MEFLNSITCVPFYLLAFTSIACALGMIFNGNLVRGGFLLIGSFSSVAGLYFMLAANFVAISQILIYAVGIVLVIVFAIMLTSLKVSASNNEDEVEQVEGSGFNKAFAAIMSIGLFVLLAYIINTQDWTMIARVAETSTLVDSIGEIAPQYTSRIGRSMMQDYLLPFELISVLLLVVLVGTVVLSKKRLED